MLNRKRILIAICILTALLMGSVSEYAQAQQKKPWKNAYLFDAIYAGKTQDVEDALKAGVDPNTRNPEWGSLLMHATINRHLDIIRLLLKYGADPKAEGNEVLVLSAIQANRMDILKCLVEAGARVKKPKYRCPWDDVLVEAIERSNIETVKYLLAHGADPQGVSRVAGNTAFQVAAMRGDIEVMKLLLNAGADINYQDWNGMTALMLACQRGKEVSVKFLIAHGADVSIKGRFGRMAEYFAKNLKGKNKDKLCALCAGKKEE